jgi:two-component system CheB/CheR fusion protein
VEKNISKEKQKEKIDSFPIVAIGASVGGLNAFSTLLQNLSPNTGMAFIFVMHLSRDHKSHLPEILSKSTTMKVQDIEDMEKMIPDNLYIIPFDKGIEVTNGHIKLVTRQRSGPPVSIDVLFSSLAETHQANVVGIILSGYLNDGTAGLKAIKEAGGITIAQDLAAEADSMPESAIASGIVDFVLSASQIGQKLSKINLHGALNRSAM